MTKQQLLKAIDQLEEFIGNPSAKRADTSRAIETLTRVSTNRIVGKHCKWMLGEMRGFIREGRLDKAQRWLGFIQGALWARGEKSIDDFKEMNRADG